MIYSVDEKSDLSEEIAKALNEYIEKNGPPPPVVESIEIVVGKVIVIQNFSVEDTK